MAEKIVLETLADLVPETDRRRRKVLSNLDKIAQGAIDAVRTYTNKHGEEFTIPQPDWNVAVKAMESAKMLLGLSAVPEQATQDAEESPTERIKRKAELALVANVTGGPKPY